eukprot:15366145-Ditylum_brightwellii.AAC.2
MPNQEGLVEAILTSCKKNDARILLGTVNSNPILDTGDYESELFDGTTEYIVTNTITEVVYVGADDEGDGIQNIYTSKGWDVCVKWKDGSTLWIPMVDASIVDPMGMSEYAVTNKIGNEPSLTW